MLERVESIESSLSDDSFVELKSVILNGFCVASAKEDTKTKCPDQKLTIFINLSQFNLAFNFVKVFAKLINMLINSNFMLMAYRAVSHSLSRSARKQFLFLFFIHSLSLYD